jgi:hypothetical protein
VIAASTLGAGIIVTGGAGNGVSVGKFGIGSPLELQALRNVRMTRMFNQRRNFILYLSIETSQVSAKHPRNEVKRTNLSGLKGIDIPIMLRSL